jgi:5,6-dimethylbenzimidazole synthase
LARLSDSTSSHRFEDTEVRGVYRAIYERRDVRSAFLPDPIPPEILRRLLEAAHHAPSVGFMQPWRFILIQDPSVRAAIHADFTLASASAAASYDEERAALYRSLKLAAITEAPLNVCVLCDETTTRGSNLGRATMPETAIYSTVCAIQNLWLAARAEGLGIGWVSILNPLYVRTTLDVPASATLVAYLCLGYVSTFAQEPDLERRGWEQRAPLEDVVYTERFGHPAYDALRHSP